MLVLDKNGQIEHKHFFDIVDYLDENDVKTILSIAPLESTSVTEIRTDTHYVDDVSLGQITYEDKESGRRKNLKMDRDCHIIYNGVALDKPFDDVLTIPFRGRLRYIDNKRDKDVLLIDEYINVIIGSLNEQESIISDSITESVFDFDDDDKIYFTRDGENIKWSDIKGTEAAMMYISKNREGNTFARVFVVGDVVTGVVEQIRDDEILVNDTWYTIATECSDEIIIGTTYTIKINDFGEVLSVDEATDDKSRIAWLLNCGLESLNAFEKSAKIRVLDTDNEIRVYELANRCTVDGKKYKDDDVYLSESMTDAPIKYMLNSEGYIVQLDTILQEEGGHNDSLVCAMNSTGGLYYSPLTKVFMSIKDGLNKFIFSADGKVIVKWDDSADPEEYKWESISSILNDSFTATAWSTDFSNGFADILLYERKSKDINTGRAFVVEGFAECLGEDDELYDVILGHNGVDEVELMLSNELPQLSAKIKTLQSGDFVSCVLDEKEYIRDIEFIYFLNGDKERSYTFEGSDYTITPIVTDENAMGKNRRGYLYGKYTYGTVLEKTNNYVLLQHVGSGETEYFHLGTSDAIMFGGDNSRGGRLAYGVPIGSIRKNSKILIETFSRGTRSVYIIEP